MLRLTNIANQYKRRTLRALYAQTQAYPYACKLDPNFTRTGGLLTATTPAVTGAKAAIYPGLVAKRLYNATNGGENVTVAADAKPRAFGLFANFVGGDLDELYGEVEVGVWRGKGGVFEVLAPAFDDAKKIDGTTSSALATAYTSDTGASSATEVYLASNPNGQLAQADLSPGPEGLGAAKSTPIDNRAVVRLVDRLSATAIIVELLV